MKTAPLDGKRHIDEHEMYRALVLEHARSPRNFGVLDNPTHCAEGINSLCGDKLQLTLNVDGDGCIVNAAFEATGCAISVASASILTDAIAGRRVDEAHALFAEFQALLESEPGPAAAGLAENLQALAGVRQFPSRIKCATLAWHAMISATRDRGGAPVTTE